MINLIQYLKSIKFNFQQLKKVDVVLLDDNYANLKFDKSIKYFLFNEQIYFYILIKSLFQFFFFKKKANNLSDFYFINLINALNPKIAIGP